MIDLESIYRTALQECAPDHILSRVLRPDLPGNVVSIGKCAGKMLDGAFAKIEIERALCCLPRGYPTFIPSPSSAFGTFSLLRGEGLSTHARRARRPIEWPSPRASGEKVPKADEGPVTSTTVGGHPDIDDSSFASGQQLIEFVDQCDEVLFLISGGGSACVEWPLPPFTRDELVNANARLVASDLPIDRINTVRKHLSAIKGGRLAARVRGRSVTLVYSDVSTGAIADVASGPTTADNTTNDAAALILEHLGGCDTIVTKLRGGSVAETVRQIGDATAELIADNGTLTATAARLVREAGYVPILWPEQIEMGVEDAARVLAQRAASLEEREVIVAGGEPTVVRRGSGKGGRCCELAVRFAMRQTRATALFGSSDGVDGSSGVAAVVVSGPLPIPAARLQALLEDSDSLGAATLAGRTIIMPPTGNNLRDLFLLTADTGIMANR